MPRDFGKCLVSNIDNQTYCWDKQKKNWVRIIDEDVTIKEVPEDILALASSDAYGGD
jgi:predicted phosphoadenosine phosphosulfate sulfurtransferase